MNPHIFREYSIRGIASQDLPDEVVSQIGRAIAVFFNRWGGRTLVVGQDVRSSSPRISRSLISGILEAGLDAIDVGVVPTPVHNFATDLYAADGGVMITASHNPSEYNGLKIRSARATLSGDELGEIHRIASDTHLPNSKAASAGRSGVSQADPLPEYLERIKAHALVPFPLKVVVDGGNGTNGLIVSGLLRDLGCAVTELFCEPDGSFPNRKPDPTAPGATVDLATKVREKGADLGLAYDGDGDRLAVVDEAGNLVLGDQIIMILARDVLKRGPARIVYEILCTQALADDVIAHGGDPWMTPSGYAFVHQAMQDTGAALGGELSGHLFFNEPAFRFDDAILGTVKLIGVLSRNQRPLTALVADLPTYHSSPELRIPCPDEAKAAVVRQVRAHYEGDHKLETLDGVRIHFDDGWGLVRQSNTQPVISMRFEARTGERLAAIQNQVQALVESLISQIEGA